MIIQSSRDAKIAFAMFLADIIIDSAKWSNQVVRRDSDLRYFVDAANHRLEIMRAFSALSDEALQRVCIFFSYQTMFNMMTSIEQQIFHNYGFKLNLLSVTESGVFPLDVNDVMISVNESMIAKHTLPPQAEI